MIEEATITKKKEMKKITPTIPGQDIVEAAMPQKAGLERHIKFLWDGHFRVNYQEKYPPHYILDSYFIAIQNGSAVIRRENKLPKLEGREG
jgi:hypothetical protein